MTRIRTCIQVVSDFVRTFSRKYDPGILGELGRGAGKGGGAGGTIREDGGPFGKMGAAREEEYYYKLQKRLLAQLKEKLKEENDLRQQEISKHKSAIDENMKLAKTIEDRLTKSENNRRRQ